MSEREPIVAGTFYPEKRHVLEKKLGEFFKNAKSGKAKACICPHAGIEYSGKTAAKAVKALEKKPTYVIICPSHTGLGSGYAVSLNEWRTPLGAIKTNKGLAQKIVEKAGLEFDEVAHMQEHSIEVILPFIQYLNKEALMVAISISTHNKEKIISLGKTLFSMAKSHEFALSASSDFSHHLPAENAREKDMKAVEKILALDAQEFFELIENERLSICGYLPITAVIEFARLGKLKPKLLEYTNSGAATRDSSSVVGYAAVVFD